MNRQRSFPLDSSTHGTRYAYASTMLSHRPRWLMIVHWLLMMSMGAPLGGCAATSKARTPAEDESNGAELGGAAHRTSRQSISGSKVAGGVLLVLGVPTMLISGGLVAAALAQPSEGAIPVLFVGPLVFLGSTLGLVAPGIALVAADDKKPQQYTTKVRPTWIVGPTGVSMTLAF